MKVGIVGVTGYVGVELLRLLLTHNKIKVSAISSKSFKDKNISEVYENFLGNTSLVCKNEEEVIENCDVIFGALPHGLSEALASKINLEKKIFIDMGADFRLEDEEDYKLWYKGEFKNKLLHEKSIYSIPELHRHKLKEKTYSIIANPGCYPTSIALALVPSLLKNIVKEESIIIDSKSGVTGSGRNFNQGTHFVNCNESLHAYAVGGTHRHIPEIEQTLNCFSKEEVKISFTPHLVPINRGILSTIYFDLKEDILVDELHKYYKEFYKDDFFIKIMELGTSAKIKNVKNSNFCNISIHKDERCNRIIICSVIDNMVKGAAGQGIQNMNIALNFDETEGLQAIAPAF